MLRGSENRPAPVFLCARGASPPLAADVCPEVSFVIYILTFVRKTINIDKAKVRVRCFSMKRLFRPFFRMCWIPVLMTVAVLFAAPPDIPSFSPDDPIPVDTALTAGRFDNGFSYFIRRNSMPENRIELRLAVNAGSVLEDDDQQGIAHFCEHMAFNGTAHFAKRQIVDFMESIGMRFGPEINAHTGFDDTVYKLTVPADSIHLVETAFQILADWAHLITFEPGQIEKERKVIVEEWRQGRGAEARMLDKQLPVLFRGSRYAYRLPIGRKEVIETCPHETLKRFYTDWYRPDLMAVVAVGDFNRADILRLIDKYFRNIPAHPDPRPRTLFPVPDHTETLFAIASDPEAIRSEVGIYYKMAPRAEKTMRDYRRMIMINLHDAMMNQRLYELTKLENPPYLYGLAAKGDFVRSKGVYYLVAGVEEKGFEEGFEALLTEAERVRRYGFTQEELERAKTNMLRYLEKLYEERDKTESVYFANEYTRHFLTEEPVPGIANEYAATSVILPDIQLDAVNALTQQWISDVNRVVLVDAPERNDLKVPSESQLMAVMNRTVSKEIPPYSETVSGEPLVPDPPDPADIIHENTIDALDVTEWTMENGVRVILKPTDFKNDEIRFAAFSPGGHSLVPDEAYVAAATAASVVKECGFGAFSSIELDKRLTGKVVNVNPTIGSLTEGMGGSCSPRDMETMFELIYMVFTSPRRDEAAFHSLQSRIRGYIENRDARPETAFRDTLQVTLARHHFRARPWSEAILNEMDLNTSFRFYKDRFGDASDFTFIFVGNFSLDRIRPYVRRYLGGLPSQNRIESWKDLGIVPPEGVIRKTIIKGLEPKSRVQLVFPGSYHWSRENNYLLDALADLMRIRLRVVLREDMGGTYGVGVWASTSHYPRERYSLNISFGCAPGKVDEMIQAVFATMDTLQTSGPGVLDVLKVKESHLRRYEVNLRQNSFWLGALRETYYHRMNPHSILDYISLVENLTAEDLKNAARLYFTGENYIQVVLNPEKAYELDE